MSLFLRIFLSFWLAAILLATSFFLLGKFSGAEAIERNKAVLKAQADIVASLWLNSGKRATMRWLSALPLLERPHLINKQGKGLMRMRSRQQRNLPTKPIEPGIHHSKKGRIIIIVSLPNVNPPLFLVRHLEARQIHQMPMIYLLPLALIIISLVSYLLAKVLTKRIRQLRSIVQIIADGDLSARVIVKGSDEVSALATDFNRMADRINDMLNSQRQLVSDVSHELRSPLARLRIALELAEKADNPKISLQRIEKEADELEYLVTGLLSLARIDSGQSQLEKQSLPLCELLNHIIEDANYEGKAIQRHVRLKDCNRVTLYADPVMLRSAIENVVRNALRYTPPNTEVTVNVVQTQDSVSITVDDQGEGVPPQDLGKLFEPFARVAEARDRLSGGYGLGLAITGKVIQAHAGQVKADNRAEGGLRVTLILPASQTKNLAE